MVLEGIASYAANTPDEVYRFVTSSYLYFSCKTETEQEEVVDRAKKAMQWLGDTNLQSEGSIISESEAQAIIEWNAKDEKFHPTEFGKAVLAAGLTAEESLTLNADLVKARESFVLSTDLHACFLCVPMSLNFEMKNYWSILFNIYKQIENRGGANARVIDLIGLNKGYLQKRAYNLIQVPDSRQERICARLFVAYVLNDLIKDVSIKSCMQKYKIRSGSLVAELQEKASHFASKARTLCEKLNWPETAAILDTFRSRVFFGAGVQTISFAKICSIKTDEARLLYSAGFKAIEDIASATVDRLCEVLASGVNRSSGTSLERKSSIELTARKIQKICKEHVLNQGVDILPPLGASTSGVSPIKPNLRNSSVAQPNMQEGPSEDHRNNQTEEDLIHNVKSNATIDEAEDTFEMSDLQKIILAIETQEILGIHINIDSHNRRVHNSNLDMPNPAIRKGRSIKKVLTHDEVFLLESLKGISVTWNEKSTYLQLESLEQKRKQYALRKLASSFYQRQKTCANKFIATFAWKDQCQSFLELMKSLEDVNLDFSQLRIVDSRIAAWMLDPDSTVVADGSSITGFQNRKSSLGSAVAIRRNLSSSEQLVKLLRSLVDTRLSQAPELPRFPVKPSHISAKISSNAYIAFLLCLPLLRQESLIETLMNIEMPVCYLTSRIERWGVGLDTKILEGLQKHILNELASLTKRASIMRRKSFDLSSMSQVKKVLFEELKLVVPPCAERKKRAKDGSMRLSVSTDKDVLSALMDKHPIVRLIQNSRKLRDSLGYVNSMMGFQQANSKSPTLHAKILQTSTASGRLAMEDPNLQCLPNTYSVDNAEGSIEINIRQSIVPVRSERIVVSADFKHIELRLMAHFSGDESLKDLLHDINSDPFQLLARKWLKIPNGEDVQNFQRQQAKQLTYGLCYGMGADRLAESLRVNPSKASRLKDDFLNAFPGLSVWMKKVVDLCRANGYITTLHNRRRWLPDINSENPGARAAAERAAINTICQGSAADIAKSAMLKVESQIEQNFVGNSICAPLLQIHDELLYEIDQDKLHVIVPIIHSAMENAATLTVPLLIKFRQGRSWGTLEDMEAK